MNILVTGANGQLGHEMQICAQKSNHKFVFTDVAEGYEKLDITNLDAIREKVRENDIQVIVNCAAYTNVDKAETDYDLVNLLNNTAGKFGTGYEGGRWCFNSCIYRLCFSGR